MKKKSIPLFDTLGIVVDLHDKEGLNLAQETACQMGDPQLSNLITLARALGKRYLITAGRFNGKGITAIVCDDDQSLITAFEMVNGRMDEIGSHGTAWMIKPDACGGLMARDAGQHVERGNKL
jgi:hypothetical protein